MVVNVALPSGYYTTSGSVMPPTVASGSGGTAPYTYAWTRVSGTFTATRGGINTATLSLSDSSGQTRSAAEGATQTETHRCTVTDSVGATAAVDVVLNVTFTSGA